MTESGLLQFGLFGGNINLLKAGFERAVFRRKTGGKATAGEEPKEEAEFEAPALLAFFLRFLETKSGAFFLLADPELMTIASWFESAWTESLKVRPVRALSFSRFLHGLAEEAKGKESFVLSLSRPSRLPSLERLREGREKAVSRFCRAQGGAFLPLPLEGERSFATGRLLSLLFQVIYGAGRKLKVNIYTQPKVDKLKKMLNDQIYG